MTTQTRKLCVLLTAILLFFGGACSDDGGYSSDGNSWDSGSGPYGGSNNGPGSPQNGAPRDSPGFSPATPVADEEPGNPGDIKVRQYFPETLLVEPELFTDENGQIELSVPLADSITRWRVSTQASSADGRLGSSAEGITVFQEFFIDIDFPPTLTLGDEITVPIAAFNYLDTAQTITVELTPASWYSLRGPATQTLEVGAGEVTTLSFPVTVERVGVHALTVTARGETRSDAVRRTVTVLPGGQEITTTASGAFKPDDSGRHVVTETITVPAHAIPDSDSLMVSIRPGLASEVIAGMDSLLRLPGATCFEVTMSAAWPNALILGYFNATESADPEIAAKAREFVSTGYQRMLAFELPSGGFNWWASAPAGNPMLSAMFIMLLADTAAVHPAVDGRVSDRTAHWLMSVQASDGSWPEEHIKSSQQLASGSLRATCFTAWSLAYAGYTDMGGTQKALDLIERQAPGVDDAYTEALCANALAESGRQGPALEQFLDNLLGRAQSEGDKVHWTAADPTLVGSQSSGAHVEVTALAALAFMAAERHLDKVQAAINWMVSVRDAGGNWGNSSQATVLALKLFLRQAVNGAGSGETDADLTVTINGEVVGTRHFDSFNEDVVWQLPAGPLGPGQHNVELGFQGQGALTWQVVGKHYLPWSGTQPRASAAVTLSVDVPKTQLEVGETFFVEATLTPTQQVGQGMYALAMNIPPGFVLNRAPLDQAVRAMWISSYEVRGSQLYVYIDEHTPGTARRISVELIPTAAATVQLGPFSAFEYYNREVTVEAEPVTLTVTD